MCHWKRLRLDNLRARTISSTACSTRSREPIPPTPPSPFIPAPRRQRHVTPSTTPARTPRLSHLPNARVSPLRPSPRFPAPRPCHRPHPPRRNREGTQRRRRNRPPPARTLQRSTYNRRLLHANDDPQRHHSIAQGPPHLIIRCVRPCLRCWRSLASRCPSPSVGHHIPRSLELPHHRPRPLPPIHSRGSPPPIATGRPPPIVHRTTCISAHKDRLRPFRHPRLPRSDSRRIESSLWATPSPARRPLGLWPRQPGRYIPLAPSSQTPPRHKDSRHLARRPTERHQLCRLAPHDYSARRYHVRPLLRTIRPRDQRARYPTHLRRQALRQRCALRRLDRLPSTSGLPHS